MSYFFVYRVLKGEEVDWDNPTGGMMLKFPKKGGIPVVDACVLHRVASQMYHCGPHEQLLVVELFEEHEQHAARVLAARYECEIAQFKELMEVSFGPV